MIKMWRQFLLVFTLTVIASLILPMAVGAFYKSSRHVSAGAGFVQLSTTGWQKFFVTDEMQMFADVYLTSPRMSLRSNLKAPSAKLVPSREKAFPQVLASRSRKFGFPFRSVQFSASLVAGNIKSSQVYIYNVILFEPIDSDVKWYDEFAVLPIGIIWSGFVLNILFWFILLGMFLSFIHLRNRRRRNRGLCLKCGYPVGMSVCPECGEKVRVEKRARTKEIASPSSTFESGKSGM